MTPQTIHMLVYKNAIANGLRTTQKNLIKNVEQFDDMIKHNDNSMNNNFWHLFKQLISQFAQMYKKTTAVATWEYHFQKLQYGLPFDEDNPDVIDTSENENCNKKIIQNYAGPSRDKSDNRYKTRLLDEYVHNKKKGLRAIPRHLDIDKRKTLDVQFDTQKFLYETFNTKTKGKTKPGKECQSLCLCSQENIWDSEKENVVDMDSWKICDHCKRHHKLYLNYNSEGSSSSWADMVEKNLKWDK